GPRALCNPWTLATTYWLTRMVIDQGTPGDLVECGVFAGVQVAAMARACQDAGPPSQTGVVWRTSVWPHEQHQRRFCRGEVQADLRQGRPGGRIGLASQGFEQLLRELYELA